MCVFLTRPYVELVNFLLKCSDEVRLWVGRRLRGQCEQHWGALCGSFGSACLLNNQSDTLQRATTTTTTATTPPPTAPWPVTAQGPRRQPTTAAEPENRSTQKTDSSGDATSGLPVLEKANVTAA